MANIRSAAKRSRQANKCNARNKALKSNYRSLKKKVEAAMASGDKKGASEGFRLYASALDRAAKNNVIHGNAAARHKSAMGKRLAVGS